MMNTVKSLSSRTLLAQISTLITAGAIALDAGRLRSTGRFGPANPFYAPSTLPFHAPPFDKIKDSDYQPAIEAGIAQKLEEIRAIADNPAEPTFENTIVAMEKSGQLINRVNYVFNGVTGANMNPVLQKTQDEVAPEAGRAAGRNLPQRQAVQARGEDLQRAQQAESRCGVAAAGRVPIPAVCAGRARVFPMPTRRS